ncbi:Gfo/Idh/MocA family protein [Actinomyces faecalis]|uniref:Gfo/Idh/MocA family protein n=1 Tax=Actinomyces faecalis TaxID=2722820 RepID=UPI001554A44B|nr:Gfo/Idh/MocA family oxidoreductase [Actinomyces faecalis]
MMKPLRTAVVGAGQRSRELLAAAQSVAGMEIVLVIDPSATARERVQEQHPGMVAASGLEAALADHSIEAALVLTPDDTHASIGAALLEAGKHVMVDKPLATTIEGADALLAAAARADRLLYPGHNMRFMPVVEILRRVVTEGMIGTPQAVWTRHFVGRGGDYFFRDWHSESARSGGLLVHKACHDLDAMCYVLGTQISAVQAIGTNAVYHRCPPRAVDEPAPAVVNDVRHWPPTALPEVNPAMDVEDLSMVNIVFEGGIMGSYAQCHFTPDYWRNYCVIGDAGRVENIGDEAGGGVLVWSRRRHGFDPQPDLRLPIQELSASGTAKPAGSAWSTGNRGGAGHDGSDRRLLEDFVSAVRTGSQPRTDALTARNVVAAGVMARRSLRGDGRLLEVPAPLSFPAPAH